MELLTHYQKLLLLLTILLFISIAIFYYILLVKNQKKIVFLHPGWLLSILLIFYGLTTPLYILFNSSNFHTMNTNFLNLYTFDNMYKIFIIYIFVFITFTICEVILLYFFKKTKVNNRELKISLKELLSQSYKITVVVMVGILMIIIAQNIYIFGGLSSEAILYKSMRYEDDGGLRISYAPVFQITFLFWFYTLVRNSSSKMFYYSVYWIFFISFSLVVLYMGTSLQILQVVIGKIFILFSFRKELMFKQWKKVISLIVILAIVFVGFDNFRAQKVEYISTEVSLGSIFEFKFPDLTRFESVTGYVPGLVILRDSNIMDNYTLLDLIISTLPGSLVKLVINQDLPLTLLIHNSPHNSTFGTYTVTLPLGLYATSGVISVFILSFIIYLLCFGIICYCFKKGKNYILLSTVFYCNLFYAFRLEIGQWLGKLRLDLLLFFTLIIILIVIQKILKNYLGKRRYAT